MPGRNAQNMPMWAFEGDYHPVKVMDGDKTLFRAKEETQTGTDMAFERTYNDHVDVVAMGRSKQEVTVQGKNLLDSDFRVFNSEYGSVSLIIKDWLSFPFASGVYVVSCFLDATQATVGDLRIQYRTYAADGVTIESTSYASVYAPNSRRAEKSFTAVQGRRVQIFVSRASELSTTTIISAYEPQFELGSVATPYEPFTPDSPSPAYPSPIISSAGELRVEGRNLFDVDAWYDWLRTYTTYFVQKVIVDDIECIYYRPNGTYSQHWMEGNFDENQQYVFSWRAKGISGIGVSTGFRIYYTDGSSTYRYVYNDDLWHDYLMISTSGKTIDYIAMLYVYGQGCYFDINSIQLEKGTEQTNYTSYRPIITHTLPELRGIPDGAGGWIARDREYIARVGNAWHKFREQQVGHQTIVGGTLYDAVAGWQRDGCYSGYIVDVLPGLAATHGLPSLCSHFKRGAWGWSTWSGKAEFYAFNQNFYFILPLYVIGATDSDAIPERRAKANVWLGTNQPCIDYILAAPGTPIDLGPIDLPSYYPFTRVLVEGDYPLDVTATCKTMEV